MGEHDLGQAGALEASHRHEAVRDLLAVRADVLDRRRAHRAGNSGEALDPGASPLDRLAHEPVPLDPRPGDELHPVRRVAERDAADGDLENEARESSVCDHEVRAPADDLHPQPSLPRGGERLAQLRLGPAFVEIPGRPAQPQGGVGCKGHAFKQRKRHGSSQNMRPARK